jgi:hypothetical protein
MTPEEIQSMREAAGFSPMPIPTGANSLSAKLKAATATNQKVNEPNIVQKAIGTIADPIIKSGVRLGQAIGAGGATLLGVDQERIDRATNQPQNLPFTGSKLKPFNEETPKSVAGTAVGTVALGVGSPVLGGALLGAGSAMENNKSAGGVAFDAALYALGGKLFDLGMKGAAPYIEKAVARYGTPIVEKLQSQLPDYAKPYLDKFVNAGNKKMSQIASKEFDEATDVIRTETSIDFDKARERAWQDIQPKTTPTTKSAYGKGSNVTEQGKLIPAKITPTKADEPVLETYQKLYQEGSITPKSTPKEKLAAVEERAAQRHQEQKNFLAENDKAVPLIDNKAGKGIITTLDNTTKNNSLIFAGNEKEAYKGAIDLFKNLLKSGKQVNSTKGATTLSEIDRVLTQFDDQMEKFGAWERRNTGQLNETDKARIQAIRDVHTAARDYIGEQLGPNNPWVSIRAEEANLYQAADALGMRLGETVGKNQIGQFFKDHPTLRKGLLWGFGSIGLGALGGIGVNAID